MPKGYAKCRRDENKFCPLSIADEYLYTEVDPNDEIAKAPMFES